jgi:DNA-directed RNA polymerase subunit E'/Rpb7
MIISSKINLDPVFLDSNIKNHIFSIIEKEYKDKCFKEYGFILNIIRIISFNENCILNTNSKIIFNVIFEVENLKLNINDEISGKILYLDKNCVLFTISKIKDIAKVLIPSYNMNGYIYSGDNKSIDRINDEKFYVHKDNSKIKYKKGDTIKAIITNLRYNNNNFDYIASLKE